MKQKKTLIGLILVGILLFSAGCGSNPVSGVAETGTDSKKAADDSVEKVQNTEQSGQKTLIVYYSYSGTTERVAEHLQQMTDGTLYEITLEDPYTGDSNAVSDRVFAERGEKKMPELSGKLPDLSEYDQILIGTPVWNNSMANPIASYLEQTDFGGKTVAPFWTYITNQGTTGKDFTKQSQDAIMEEGLPIPSANGMSDETLDQMLENWLSEIQS